MSVSLMRISWWRAWLRRALAASLWGALILGAAAADPLAGWHPTELEWQVRFQGAGEFAGWMRAVSALGPGTVLAALVAVLLYGYDPRLATRLGLLMFGALWLREVLALAWQSPRPFWIEPRLQTFGDSAVRAARFGLPSGHALVSAAFWFRMALDVRRGRWAAWAAAIATVTGVAVSRVYLGVHFVSDVVVGVVVGTLVAGVSRAVEGPAAAWHGRLDRRRQVVWALATGVAMGFSGVLVRSLFAAEAPASASTWGGYGEKARTVGVFFELGGTVSGIGLGLAMLREWAGGRGVWWRRLVRVAVAGVVVKWGLREPLAAVVARGFGEAPESLRCAALFLSGAIQGWAVWGGLPWLFLRLGLAAGDGRVSRGSDVGRRGVGA